MRVKRKFLTAALFFSFLHLFSLAPIFFFSSPVYSIELIDRDSLFCDLSGNIKGIYFGIHDNPLGSSHDSGLVLLRLILTGTITENASIEFHLLEGGMINPLPVIPSGFTTYSQASRFRVDSLTHTQTEHEDFSSQISIDRANITLRLPRCDLTVGRQAISLGTTYFWNPNDLFTSFSPYEFDRDYKAGVDGAKADIALGDFSGISFIYVAGKKFRFNESALLIRAFTNILDFDLAMMAGRFREDGFVGADFSGEVGPGIGLRGELSYFAAESDDDFFQVVIGSEYRFKNNFYITAEYYYNGFGTSHTHRYLSKLYSTRIMEGDLYNISRHYLGIMGSYEVTPLLVVSLATIVNLNDQSVLIDPTLIYSLSDNAELVAGMVMGEGKDPKGPRLRSEFGSYPDFTFVEIKYYF